MIRKATFEDIDAVEQNYIELLTHEKEHGAFTKWALGVYPTRETALRGCEMGSLHVLETDEGICASVILDQLQPEEYSHINWMKQAKPDEVLVIHTLCVSPSKAGAGLGKEMVRYAIARAKQMGCKAIRLDTGVQNKPAVAVYTKLGFRNAGTASMLLHGLIPNKGQVFFEIEIEDA